MAETLGIYVVHTIFNAEAVKIYFLDILVTFLGLFRSPFYFSWSLLSIISLSRKMTFLVRSLFAQVKMICLTLSLILIVLYVSGIHVFDQFTQLVK